MLLVSNSFLLFLVTIVVWPGAPSSVLAPFVAMPGAPNVASCCYGSSMESPPPQSVKLRSPLKTPPCGENTAGLAGAQDTSWRLLVSNILTSCLEDEDGLLYVVVFASPRSLGAAGRYR